MTTNTENQIPHHEFIDSFDTEPMHKQLRRILRGLKSPHDSGDFKYARLQMLRLLSPISAITVPIIMLLLLMAIPQQMGRYVERTITTTIIKIDPMPDIPEDPIIKPDDVTEVVSTDEHFSTESIIPTPDVNVDVGNPDTDNSIDTKPPDFCITRNPSSLIMDKFFSPFKTGEREGGLEKNRGSYHTEGAVIKALNWLAMVQEENGSWRQESGGGPGKGTPAAMTGLALMTFLAHGDTPSVGNYKTTVENAMKWLVNNQEENGNYKEADSHNYTLPIAAYALCEAYAITKTPAVKTAAEKSMDIILKGQHPGGGWDYNCQQSERSDTSYMGWCAQAVKAAKLAKLDNEGIDAAIRKTVMGFKQNAHREGGFGYTDPGKTPLTGVGVLCLQLLGLGRDIDVRQGLLWLEQATCKWDEPWSGNPFYHWYYVTQAKFHASPAVWDKWNSEFAFQLVKNQTVIETATQGGQNAGYWKHCSESEHCKSYVYNTALCTLMLEIYYRELLSFKTQKDTYDELIVADANDVNIVVTMTNNIDRINFETL